MTWWQRHLGLILGAILVIGMVFNILGGARWYPLNDLWASPVSMAGKVIWGMRVPRMLASVMVGALLKRVIIADVITQPHSRSFDSWY